VPLPYLSAYAAGVQLHVEDLRDHLAARERSEDFKARWDELHPAYQALEKSRSSGQNREEPAALGGSMPAVGGDKSPCPYESLARRQTSGSCS